MPSPPDQGECGLFPTAQAPPWSLSFLRQRQPTKPPLGYDLQLWAGLPREVWALVFELLHDLDVCHSVGAAARFRELFGGEEAWAGRARCAWSRLRGLAPDEKEALLRAPSGKGYFARRTLLRGVLVQLQAGRQENKTLAQLVRHCGGRLVQEGGKLLLLGRGAGRTEAPRRGGPRLVGAAWLRASVVAGRQLPMHSAGCPANGSAFRVPSQCKAGCLAPGVLEGQLVSSSGLRDKEAVAELVQVLGGEYTEELSPAHSCLVATVAEGLKFEFARSRGMPVVSREWLEQTARLGMPMQHRFFAVRAG